VKEVLTTARPGQAGYEVLFDVLCLKIAINIPDKPGYENVIQSTPSFP